MAGKRWRDAGVLMSRTTYHLVYDAQEFPWQDTPPSVVDVAASAAGLKRMWEEARSGAERASIHLSGWLRRWCSSGRRVTVVGFSLGAFVVWEAAKLLPERDREKLDLIFISGAMVDGPDEWRFAGSFSSIVNVWSSSDLVLRWLYPAVVSGTETPAVGLGPISSVHGRNLDLTDLIGTDHLWAGRNIVKILRVVIGVESSATAGDFPRSDPSPMTRDQVERLCSWLVVVPDLWDELGRLLEGSPDADAGLLSGVDLWSSGSRLGPLLNASSTVSRLLTGVRRRDVADRSIVQLEGFIRRWMAQSRQV